MVFNTGNKLLILKRPKVMVFNTGNKLLILKRQKLWFLIREISY